jgi:structural maintenance of chromosome 4
MRQGKLSELIHNSARYPELSHCGVEVHFREIIDEVGLIANYSDSLAHDSLKPGPDAYTVVPNSELIVARIAFRNNSSKYTINRRPSNFTEVTTLLRHRGIDLDHKRFLILQVRAWPLI